MKGNSGSRVGQQMPSVSNTGMAEGRESDCFPKVGGGKVGGNSVTSLYPKNQSVANLASLFWVAHRLAEPILLVALRVQGLGNQKGSNRCCRMIEAIQRT